MLGLVGAAELVGLINKGVICEPDAADDNGVPISSSSSTTLDSTLNLSNLPALLRIPITSPTLIGRNLIGHSISSSLKLPKSHPSSADNKKDIVWLVSFRLWRLGRRGKGVGEAREERRRFGGVVDEIRMDMDCVAGVEEVQGPEDVGEVNAEGAG